MTKEDYIRLGFEPMGHYTVADALLYQLGRNRHISAGCVGTPNEMLWLCQQDDKDPRITTDLVCLHNWDYDKEMTEEKLTLLIKALSGGVDSSAESGGENGVLHDVRLSLPDDNALNFLHWMNNWGHLAIDVKVKYFTGLINQYNDCSEHDHNLGNEA